MRGNLRYFDWMERSGNLSTPGKSFYMNLAADTIRDLNSSCDADGYFYVLKAMIRCGMSYNLNGNCEVQQFSPSSGRF